MENINLTKNDLENIINALDNNTKLHSLFGEVDSEMYRTLLDYSDLTDKMSDIIYNSNNIEFLKDLFVSSVSRFKFIYQNLCDELYTKFSLYVLNHNNANEYKMKYTLTDVVYYVSLSETILKYLIKFLNNNKNINEDKDQFIDYYNEALYDLYERGIIYSYDNADELLTFIKKIKMTQNIFSMMLMYSIKYRNLEFTKKFVKIYYTYNFNKQPIEYIYNDPRISNYTVSSFISKNRVIKKISKDKKYDKYTYIEEIKDMYPIMYILPYMTYINTDSYMVTGSTELFDYITSNINIDYTLKYNDFDLLNIAVYGIENVKNLCYKDKCKKFDTISFKTDYHGVSSERQTNSKEALNFSLYIINHILSYCDTHIPINKELANIKFDAIKGIDPLLYLFRCSNIAMAYHLYNYSNTKPEYFNVDIKKSYNIIKSIIQCSYYSYIYDTYTDSTIEYLFNKYMKGKNISNIYLTPVSKVMYLNIWSSVINSTSMSKNNTSSFNYVDIVNKYFNVFTDDDTPNNTKNKITIKTSYVMLYKYITGRDLDEIFDDIDKKVIYRSRIEHIYFTKNIWGKLCMKYRIHKVYKIYLNKTIKMIKNIKKLSE